MKYNEVVHWIAGKEQNIDTTVMSSDVDTELTSAALSTAAMSAAAAAAAAAAADDADDTGGGWQMCDVETRIIPPDWYNYVSSHVHTYTKYVTRTKCLSIGRIGGAGSHWWYMVEVKKWQQNKKFSDGISRSWLAGFVSKWLSCERREWVD